MIYGVVNLRREATLPLVVSNTNKQQKVINTEFSGFLSLAECDRTTLKTQSRRPPTKSSASSEDESIPIARRSRHKPVQHRSNRCNFAVKGFMVIIASRSSKPTPSLGNDSVMKLIPSVHWLEEATT